LFFDPHAAKVVSFKYDYIKIESEQVDRHLDV